MKGINISLFVAAFLLISTAEGIGSDQAARHVNFLLKKLANAHVFATGPAATNAVACGITTGVVDIVVTSPTYNSTTFGKIYCHNLSNGTVTTKATSNTTFESTYTGDDVAHCTIMGFSSSGGDSKKAFVTIHVNQTKTGTSTSNINMEDHSMSVHGSLMCTTDAQSLLNRKVYSTMHAQGTSADRGTGTFGKYVTHSAETATGHTTSVTDMANNTFTSHSDDHVSVASSSVLLPFDAKADKHQHVITTVRLTTTSTDENNITSTMHMATTTDAHAVTAAPGEELDQELLDNLILAKTLAGENYLAEMKRMEE